MIIITLENIYLSITRKIAFSLTIDFEKIKGLVYFGTFKKLIFIFLHFSKVYVSKNIVSKFHKDRRHA